MKVKATAKGQYKARIYDVDEEFDHDGDTNLAWWMQPIGPVVEAEAEAPQQPQGLHAQTGAPMGAPQPQPGAPMGAPDNGEPGPTLGEINSAMVGNPSDQGFLD